MEITEQDKLNNPGVDEHTIQAVQEQYHFHRISSASLSGSILHCTFVPDPDPSSIFYTPLERGAAPVREYRIEGIEEKVEIAPDALAVKVGETLISSETIFSTPTLPTLSTTHTPTTTNPEIKNINVNFPRGLH